MENPASAGVHSVASHPQPSQSHTVSSPIKPSGDNNKKKTGLFVVLAAIILMVGIGLTVFLGQNEQDIRQRASETPNTVCRMTNVDVILVIDASNSMQGKKLAEAKQAARNFSEIVINASPQNKVGVAYFNNRSGLVQNLTHNLAEINNSINKLQAPGNNEGGTCLECAIDRAKSEADVAGAFKKAGNDGNQHHVIILTDGRLNRWQQPNGNIVGSLKASDEKTARDQAEAAIARVSRANDVIFSFIQMGSTNEGYLKAIIKKYIDDKGTYLKETNQESLTDLYAKMAEKLTGKGEVSGIVFNDKNRNGVKDTGEEGLAGWTVKLTNDMSLSITSSTGDTTEIQGGGKNKGGNNNNNNKNNGGNNNKNNKNNGGKNNNGGNNGGKNNGGKNNNNKGDGGKNNNGKNNNGGNNKNNNNNKKKNNNNGTNPQPAAPAPVETLTAVTDANGKFVFTGRCDGDYKLFAIVQPNWTMTLPKDKYYIINMVPANIITDKDFGVYSNTPTINPAVVQLNVTVFMHGIGKAGDNPNPFPPQCGGPGPIGTSTTLGIPETRCLSNQNPLTANRPMTIELLNTANLVVSSAAGTLVYNATGGNFSGSASISAQLPAGSYSVKISSEKYLTKLYPNVVSVKTGANTLPVISMVVGDVYTNEDSKNQLDIRDYNALIGCYTSPTLPAKDCNIIANQKFLTDFNDDGVVNDADYNLFIRELSVQFGD